ncbi:MAG: glycosyltransferase [Candidatus Pacebacteria bacterium]|nr:glycosyltransferase [Candidatus Paceibacterota bacterium]
MNPKVSIIMPVYNGEKFLRESIESVLNQTFDNFEFIIINDGSKDNSLNIIKEYDVKDKRIKIIDQENKGVSSSRNNGIKSSNGKYITFIDCDDIWLINKLETQINEFEKDKELKICGTWAKVINEYGEIISNFNYPPLTNILIRIESIYKNPFITSSIIFKKEIIDNKKLFLPKMKLAEDYEFITKYIYKNKSKNINQTLIKYRIHQNNSDNTIYKKFNFKIIAIKIRFLALSRLVKSIF